MPNSPLLYGPAGVAINTQNGFTNLDGSLVRYGGPINYIANSHFDRGIVGPALINATVTSGVVSGAIGAGAGSLALSQETSAPIRGAGSLKVAGASGWINSQGVAFPAFTVNTADLGKVLTYKFSYSAVTGPTVLSWGGTLGTQNLSVWIYDVTNTAWIQPSGYLGMNQNSGVGVATGTFQSSTTAGQQYQLVIINLVNTAASSTAILLDDVFVGTQTVPVGSVVTDWTAFTPTGSWLLNSPTYTGYYRRVGGDVEVQVNIALTGAPTNAALTVNLPTGMTIDTARMPGTPAANITRLPNSAASGKCAGNASAFLVAYNTTTSVAVFYQSALTGAESVFTQTAPATWANGDSVNLCYSAPIAGWGSSGQLSSDTDTRVVAMQVSQAVPTATITGSFSLLKFTSAATSDTHGAFDPSTGKYTVPVSGYYRCSAGVQVNATFANTNLAGIGIGKNSVSTCTFESFQTAGAAEGSLFGMATGTIYCIAGDLLAPLIYSNATTPTIGGAAVTNYFHVERLSGPSVVAATESVILRATNTSGQNITNNSGTTVTGWTTVKDSHAAFTASTGVYTCPVSGSYHVFGQLKWAQVSTSAGLFYAAYVYKNAGLYFEGFENYSSAQGSPSWTCPFTSIIPCNAGDTISVQAFQNSTATRAIYSAASTGVHLSIVRIGN